ncbi:triosephosphate isomerase, partial [mine drainage metagenome]
MTETNTPSVPARNASARRRATIDPRLTPPVFLLNLKCYPAALGPRADSMARSLAAVGREYGVSVGLIPSLPDLGRVAASKRLPVLSPHCDPQPPGASTGYAIPEALLAAGASGSLVNHSEHRLSPALLRSTVDRLDRAGLVAVLCTRDARES